MDEYTNITKPNSGHFANWLRIFFFIHIASLAVTVVSDFPIEDGWATWVNYILMAGMILCLFQLSCANRHYRYAAVFRTVLFCLGLAGTLIASIAAYLSAAGQTNALLVVAGLFSTPIALLSTVFSILAAYQECSAHSKLIFREDPKLAKKWHSLFLFEIIISLITSFASAAAASLVMHFQWDITTTYSLILAVILLPGKIISIVRIFYLHRTIRLIQTQGETYG